LIGKKKIGADHFRKVESKMAIFSFIVLILLSLVAYSSGAVMRGGKTAEIRPRIIDLLAMLLIWGGTIYSRLAFVVNKWFLVAIWFGISYALGTVIVSFRKHNSAKKPADTRAPGSSRNPFKNLWKTWQQFSRRMGAFQSRILLSLFYFFLVTPIGLVIKIFSDPLNIKHKNQGASGSYWLSKKAINGKIDDFRRQF
jgi:hypothetical protein